jgi:hypothetical protein
MPAGRPTKLTPEVISQIAEAFLYGFTDQEVATLVDIDVRTIERARRGTFCRQIKRAELARKNLYIRRITEGKRPDWARWAWFLERRFPLQFAKPEIQLSVNTTNQTVNNTLIVTAEVAHQMSSRVKDADAKVTELFKRKTHSTSSGQTPQLKNGNGNGNKTHQNP